MFANTITLTIGGAAKVLNRVNQDAFGSEYTLKGATESISMKIRHTQDSPDGDNLKMDRHNVFVEHVIYPTATTPLRKMTTTVTIRGASQQDPSLSKDTAVGVMQWAATSANIAGLVVGEN